MSSTTTAALTVLLLPSFRMAGNRRGMIIAGERMHSDHNLCCDAAICRWQLGSVGLYGADGACMCAVILLHSCRLFHHSLSLVVPWLEVFHHHLHSLTQGAWPSVVFLPDPQMLYSSLSLCAPSPRSSEKQWFMNCNIYHKTVLLHACSYMIHPQVLLGPHRQRMPICLGKEKVKLWAQKTQRDPRKGVSKVQYVHFYPALRIWLWWKKSNNDKTITLG